MLDISSLENAKITYYINNLEELKKQLRKDFVAVKVKFDNFMIHNLHSTVRDSLLCSVHGDKQCAVMFILYTDRMGKVRAFIPRNNLLENKVAYRKAIPYDADKEKEFFTEDNMKSIYRDWINRTVVRMPKFFDNKYLFNVAGDVNKDMLKKYIARFGDNLYGYIADGLQQGYTYSQTSYYDVSKENIEDIKVEKYGEIIKGNGFRKAYAILSLKLKEIKHLYFFLYVDSKGRLRTFLPLRGNNYDHKLCSVIPEDRNSFVKFDKMAKDFDRYTVSNNNLEADIENTSLEELNGIPLVEEQTVTKIKVQKATEKEIISAYDEKAVKDKVKKLFGKTAKINNKITDKSKVHYGETNISYSGGTYCIICECTMKDYHPFYAVGYINAEGNFDVTIPVNNNILYGGKPIKKEMTLKFKNKKDPECDLFEVIEENADDFEVYEVRHARPYGKNDLLTKVQEAFKGDYLEAVKKKDIRSEIKNIIYNENVIEREDGLCYILMDADNCKVCFYLDTMNALHLYVPYNKDYERDLEETIIC